MATFTSGAKTAISLTECEHRQALAQCTIFALKTECLSTAALRLLVSHLIMCQPFRCPLLNPRSAVTISWVWWKKDATSLTAMQMPSSKNTDIFLIEQIFNSF